MLLGAGSGKGEKHTDTHAKGPTARQRLAFKRPSDLFLLFGEVDGERRKSLMKEAARQFGLSAPQILGITSENLWKGGQDGALKVIGRALCPSPRCFICNGQQPASWFGRNLKEDDKRALSF